MALRKIERRRAPINGMWFRTEGRLNSIMRAASRYDDNCEWPKFVNDTLVPIWVSMRLYQAQETRECPDGMIYGPVVRVGSFQSPEVELFGHHWSASLSYDDALDGFKFRHDKWMYHPLPGDIEMPGEDASLYICDKCEQSLYRDDNSELLVRSATLFNGELVCRDCDVTGLVIDADSRAQIERCRRLADSLGPEYRKGFDRNIERLSGGFSFGRPGQTRVWKEDRFSFYWMNYIFTEEGRKRGMCGGLIQHGPCPIEDGDGFKFRTWDYSLNVERDAKPEEVKSINWSIHT